VAAPAFAPRGVPAVTPEPAGPNPSSSPFSATGASPVAVAPEPVDGEDEAPRAPRRHPYTWLHLLILALVAFVLGFLVVALWNQDKSGGSANGAAAAVVVVTAASGSSSAV